MSLYLSSLSESGWGLRHPMRSVVAALEDPTFNPGLTSTIDASSVDEGPLSPAAGLFLRARYGPYILYLHLTQQIPSLPPCIPKNINWAMSGDLTFTAGWSGNRLALSCNLETYTEPHTEAGDGWCGVCGRPHLLINAYAAGLEASEQAEVHATGSGDHWYAQSGLHTNPDTHSGPLTAATTIPALIRASAITRDHCADKLVELSENAKKSGKAEISEQEAEEDAWVNGWRTKGDLSSLTSHWYQHIVLSDPAGIRGGGGIDVMVGASAHDDKASFATKLDDAVANYQFPELLDALLEYPIEALEIVNVTWVPVHWGGYSYHSIAVVILRNGFVLSICPLSLRIIQLQHISLAPEVSQENSGKSSSLLSRAAKLALGRARNKPTTNGAETHEVVYEIEKTTVRSASVASDGVGGAVLSVSHALGVWMCPLKHIAADLEKRMILPSVAGYSVWPSLNIPAATPALVPLQTTPLSTKPQHWSPNLLPADATPLALAPPTSPDADFEPVQIALPKLLSQWLAVGAGIECARLSPLQKPPRSIRRTAAALVTLAANWWFATPPAPPTRYLPPPRRCIVENTTVLRDGTRNAVHAIVEPTTASISTGKGSWPISALHCLARLHSTRAHANDLYKRTYARTRAPLPLPLLPWAARLAPSRADPSDGGAGTYVAITDTLGRVSLFDSASLKIVHQWGGHRAASVHWVWPVPVASSQIYVSEKDSENDDSEAVTALANKSVSTMQDIHPREEMTASVARALNLHSSPFSPPTRPCLLIHGARGIAEVWAVHPVVMKVGSINLGGGVVVPCMNSLSYTHLTHQIDMEAFEAVWRTQRTEIEQVTAEMREEMHHRAQRNVKHPLQMNKKADMSLENKQASEKLKEQQVMRDEEEFFDMDDSVQHTSLSLLETTGTSDIRAYSPQVNDTISTVSATQNSPTLEMVGIRRVLFALVGVLVVSEGGSVDVLMTELDLQLNVE